MAFTLWNLFEAALLCLNAVCVLHEERFLAKIGWSSKSPSVQGFGEQPTAKAQILNLVHSIRTVARSDIINYLGESTRPFVEREALFNAGHITKCGFADTNNIILGWCLQTSALNREPHAIRIQLHRAPSSEMAIHFNKYRLKCVNHSSKTINDDGAFEAKLEVIFRNADKSEIMD
ncbi:hypothetical protein ILUMI_00284 [Ignelater luminosus]|uniref:Immediate early response 3-interacting protein 1 n=1 Tax=Ignelater luminosus TaxID=2038154 RepID=A0A8K0GMS6_IGNLU|nr:hypothetical protein ILUMI_00284 [Ignelater luminosus]